jgi:hypothetical protein
LSLDFWEWPDELETMEFLWYWWNVN